MAATCPRCKSQESEVRYDFGRERILRCRGCTLLFLHPWPDPDRIAEVYGESYFRNQELLHGSNESLYGYKDYVAERFNKQPQYARIAREMRALMVAGGRTPRLLEVGCGLGYFLDQAFEEGFEVEGVEFNPHAVERLRRKYSFPIHSGALEDADLPSATYDAAAMFDVIEHLRDPFGCLDKLRQALAPGGLLVISTPDAESWVSRMIGARLEDFRRTREHLFFFSRRTLEEVLDEHGFDLLEIRSIGHTFELALLLDRLALYHRPLFRALRRAVQAVGLGGLQIPINPHTKMIALARRRGGTRPAAAGAVSELDQRLLEDLHVLEHASPRHYRSVYQALVPHLGRRVLEVGSGIGVISKFLISRCEELVLSDHQEIYLERLRARFGDLPSVHYRRLDLDRPPFDAGGVELDTVLCVNVLEHIEDEQAALRGLAELLPAGGRLVLQVPNYPRLYGSLDRSYGHYRRYSPKSLRRALDTAGFRTVALERFNPFSIPGWIVSAQLLRSPRLDPRALRAYDGALPWLRPLGFLSRVAGLSLIACAEKR